MLSIMISTVTLMSSVLQHSTELKLSMLHIFSYRAVYLYVQMALPLN